MMEEVPEGQGALVQIRDQMLVDAAAPGTPTPTRAADPTITPIQRPRNDKRKRVSQGVQNRIAKAAAIASAAADVAEAAVDAIPGRWWPRRSIYLPFRCDDGLAGPELAGTHGRLTLGIRMLQQHLWTRSPSTFGANRWPGKPVRRATGSKYSTVRTLHAVHRA